MGADAVYLDTSAIAKLIIDEPGSAALRTWLPRRARHASSAVIRTELARAVRLGAPGALERVAPLLGRLDLIAVDDSLLTRAGLIDPASLRPLDAIHIAAALSLEDDLRALVTYDRRMAESARTLGMPVASPR